MTPTERLRELGIRLPPAPPVNASYVPTRLVPLGENRVLAYIAGQGPFRDGNWLVGRVPDQVAMDEAQDRARVTMLNVLAQIDSSVGLDQVEQVVQVLGWVHSEETFGQQHIVMNAASDLLEQIFGEAGKHSRAALGANTLPLGITVEIVTVVQARV